jgi:hypothetical protein
MKYFRDLFFYFLEFVGALVNLCGSFLGVYPKLELGLAYLLHKQGRSVKEELAERQKKREEQEDEAQVKFEEAKRLTHE